MNSKQKKYKRLTTQLSQLLKDSPDSIAQMSTINAVLYHKMQDYFWVGFYFVRGNELIVGPYQGPVACQRLKKPQGVCWTSVITRNPVVVADVEEFPGHIACDSRTKSEIVIPIKNSTGEVIAVLDIDSDKLNHFDNDDKQGLQNIISLIQI